MKKRLAIAAVILAVVFGGLAYFQLVMKPEMIAQMMSGNRPPPVAVTAAPAQRQDWQPYLTAIGTLQAIEGVTIAPQVAGIVSEIHFESGEETTAGTLLLKLDDSVEQADLKSNLASLKEATLALARGRELFKKKDFSKASLDATVAQQEVAAAQVERTHAQIEHKAITAPFAGRLGLRQANLGQYLSAGDPIVTLQSLDPIYVTFPIPEQELANLRTGRGLSVAVDAVPGREFQGEITSIDARVDQSTRNIMVQGTLANPDHTLLPGMFANVHVLLPRLDAVVTVAQTAIAYSPYGDSVFVVVDGTSESGEPVQSVEKRQVTVGERRGDSVIVTEGLSGGEMVVTAGQVKLRNGAAVKIDNSVTLVPPAVRPRT